MGVHNITFILRSKMKAAFAFAAFAFAFAAFAFAFAAFAAKCRTAKNILQEI